MFIPQDLNVTLGNSFSLNEQYYFDSEGRIAVVNNSLSFVMSFKQYFQSNTVELSINSNSSLIQTKEKVKLSYNYQSQQIQLQPIISSGSSVEFSKSMGRSSEAILNQSRSSAVSTLKEIQLLFYILNSIQVTSIPILINMTMPMNLYETLRIFSSLVYWHIPAWS